MKVYDVSIITCLYLVVFKLSFTISTDILWKNVKNIKKKKPEKSLKVALVDFNGSSFDTQTGQLAKNCYSITNLTFVFIY